MIIIWIMLRPAFVVVKGLPSPSPILDRGEVVHGMRTHKAFVLEPGSESI